MMKKVLIVDDNFDDLLTMKDILTKKGYHITTATNGAQALDNLEENPPNIIIEAIRP